MLWRKVKNFAYDVTSTKHPSVSLGYTPGTASGATQNRRSSTQPGPLQSPAHTPVSYFIAPERLSLRGNAWVCSTAAQPGNVLGALWLEPTSEPSQRDSTVQSWA